MSVPAQEDEGLTGRPFRGVINFEGATIGDCVNAIDAAMRRIVDGWSEGVNYQRDDSSEVGFYRFEIERPSTEGENDE